MYNSINTQAVYCEDIRYEIDDAYSLIGVRHHQWIVDDFPALIDSFSIDISIFIPADEKYINQATKIKVLLNNDILDEFEMASIPQLAYENAVKSESTGCISGKFHANIRDIKVSKPSQISVMVEILDEVCNAFPLAIIAR